MSNRPVILVVDDDEQLRELIATKLRKENMRVLAAANGHDAIRILTAEPTVDVIILDLELPNMRGDMLCRAVRAYPHYQHIPILMMSANPELASTAGAAGAAAILPKPFALSTLIQTVRQLLPH